MCAWNTYPMSAQCLDYMYANLYNLCTIFVECVHNTSIIRIQFYSTCVQYLCYVCSIPREYECNMYTIHVQCVYKTFITCRPSYAFFALSPFIYTLNYTVYTLCYAQYIIHHRLCTMYTILYTPYSILYSP